MDGSTVRQSAASAVERIGWWPLFGLLAIGAVSSLLGPERFATALVVWTGLTVVAIRPQLGVTVIFFMLMVQYGTRRYERGGVAGGLTSLVPQGSGLLSLNNVLGLFLGLLLLYRLSISKDWSFLKSRTVQLILAVTAVLVFSAFVSGISATDHAEIGLRATTEQDPSRLLLSRALFVVLFVFFFQRPRDLRMIIGLFLVLALFTAWSGSSAALSGAGRAETSAYRAGGTAVLIESTQNPNRLAMIATLALIYIWQYTEAFRSGFRRWAALGSVLLLVVTVFLTASRGGLIGLVFAGIMLFVRRRGGSGRWLYGVVAIAVAAVLVQEIVPPQAMERITNIPGIRSVDDRNSVGQGSLQRRQYTYGIAIDIWRKAPIVGVGPGNWSYVRFLTDPMRSTAGAHNSYLAALAEGGVVSLTLYVMLFYLTLRHIMRCERDPEALARAKRDGLDWVLVATRICLAAFLVFSLFADLWDLFISYFLLGIAAVLIQRYMRAPGATVPA